MTDHVRDLTTGALLGATAAWLAVAIALWSRYQRAMRGWNRG